MDWKEIYPDKKKRPAMNELRAYFTPDVFEYFTEFSSHLAQKYGINCAPAVYTATHGWTFRFGRSGVYLLSGIYIADGCFHVAEIAVKDKRSLKEALSLVYELYTAGFQEKYDAIVSEKKTRQSSRTKLRLEREKQETAAMQDKIQPDKFNRYRWSPKVSRRDLSRLYELDAKMLYDEELADEIGFTLYARCIQGRDVMLDINSGKLKCHHCDHVLLYQQGLMTCPCGYQYLFRDYMRNFRKENMPTGAATHIFNAFIENWPKAGTYHKKMQLIDDLIHEFHINLVTGVKGRFIGINLIEGTKKQIGELILTLAYGNEKEHVIEQFKQNASGQI